jgi:hypothetical protein
MQGLLLRLSTLDPDTANALRVIAFFDKLVTGRAGLELVLRSAAELAECPVGISSPGLGRYLRSDPGAGLTKSQDVPAHAACHQLEDGTVVWVARAGNPAPLDEILLERFAMTVANCLDHVSLPRPRFGDSELVEVVLSNDAEPADRARALRLLRLEPTAQLRVHAATGISALEGRATQLGSVWALLCTGSTPHPVEPGSRWGVGPDVCALDAARSWRAARTALRFTTPTDPVVCWADLGCLTALACLDHRDLTRLPDVTALDQLAETPHGQDTLAMLEVLCTTGSVRKAADALHRHHSTMRTRIDRVQAVLRFPIDTPDGRLRLHLALRLRRLRDNPGDQHQTTDG